MILHGENLIISANGSVLAGAKTCSLDVDVDTIKVSSPTDGDWEHVIAGIKSWKISTGHLLPNVMSQYPIVEAVSPSWVEMGNGANPKVTFTLHNGSNLYEGKGLYIFNYTKNVTTEEWGVTVFGPYNTDDVAIDRQNFVDGLNNSIGNDPSSFRVIVSKDAFTITPGMQNAIATRLNIAKDYIPLISGHGAFAAIGGVGNARGICLGHSGRDAGAHVRAYYIDSLIQTLETPLRSAVERVGQMFTISLQIDGFGTDRLQGTALCKQFKVSAAKGSLMQGSFSFVGSGPLQ